MQQKVVDIRIIKGRRQEDIDAAAAARLKIRTLAEEEYKLFITGAKAALERATKRFCSLPVDSTVKEKASAAVAALSKEAAFTINEWIHLVGNFCSSADSPVTKAFIAHFRNEYDTPSQIAHRAVIEGCGFEYNKTKGLPLRDLVPEASIERQMLALIGEGWCTQGSLCAVSGDMFSQTMVKYEEPAAAPIPPLGVRRLLEN